MNGKLRKLLSLMLVMLMITSSLGVSFAAPQVTITFLAGDYGIFGTDSSGNPIMSNNQDVNQGTVWGDLVGNNTLVVPTPIPDPGYKLVNWEVSPVVPANWLDPTTGLLDDTTSITQDYVFKAKYQKIDYNFFIAGDDTYEVYINDQLAEAAAFQAVDAAGNVIDASTTTKSIVGYPIDAVYNSHYVNYNHLNKYYYAPGFARDTFIAIKGEDITGDSNAATIKAMYKYGSDQYEGTDGTWWYFASGNPLDPNDPPVAPQPDANGREWYEEAYQGTGWKQIEPTVGPALGTALNDVLSDVDWYKGMWPNGDQDGMANTYKWVWSDKNDESATGYIDTPVYLRSSKPIVPKYTLTYNGNQATSGVMPDETHEVGSTFNLTKNTYVRTGYTFNGWNTAADGSGTIYLDEQSYTMPAGDTTLYAQWVKDNTATYDFTVEYYKDGVLDSTETRTVWVGTTAVALSSLQKPYVDYSFDSVVPAADGSGNVAVSAGVTVKLYYKKTDYNFFIAGDDTYEVYINDQLAEATAHQEVNAAGNVVRESATTAPIVGFPIDAVYNGHYGNYHHLNKYHYAPGFARDTFIAIKGEDITGDANAATIKAMYKYGSDQYEGTDGTWWYFANGNPLDPNDPPVAPQPDANGREWYEEAYQGTGWKQIEPTVGPALGTALNDVLSDVDWYKGMWPNGDQDGMANTYKWVWSDKNDESATGYIDTPVYLRSSKPSASKYTLTYNGNQATSGVMPDETHEADSTFNLTKNTYVRTGYTFEGWNTAADGSGTTYLDEQSYTMPAGDTTLYALWEKDNTATYDFTVEYYKDGVLDSTETRTVWVGTTAVALSSLQKPYVDYSFDSVVPAADGSGNVAVSAGVTVKLYYKKTDYNFFISGDDTYEVYINDQLAEATAHQEVNAAGNVVRESATTAPIVGFPIDAVYNGHYGNYHHLNKYHYAPGFARDTFIAIKGEDITGDSNAATIKAMYKYGSDQYEGTDGTWWYFANGNPLDPNDPPVAPQPDANGREWYEEAYQGTGWKQIEPTVGPALGTALNDALSDVDWYKGMWPNGDQDGMANTYKWVWSDKNDESATGYIDTPVYLRSSKPIVPKYTLTYNGNQGTAGVMPDETHEAGSTFNLTKNTYVRTGYTFNGWNTAADGSGTTYLDEQSYTMPAGDTTLYALWEKDNTATYDFTVEYYKDGVLDSTETRTVWVGTTAVALSSLQKAFVGYSFDSVVPAADGSGNVAVSDGATVKLYYVKDNTTTFSFTVEYYKDGVLDSTETRTVWSGTTAVALSSLQKAFTGYSFDSVVPAADGSGNVAVSDGATVKLYYVKDNTTTFSFTVEYYKDGVLDSTETRTVWSGTTAVALSGLQKAFTGYSFDSVVPAADGSGNVAVSDGATVKLYYVKDNTTTFGFTVEYYKDGVLDSTETRTVWSGTTAVALSSLQKAFTGYNFDSVVPAADGSGNVAVSDGATVKLYYLKDTVTKKYTVTFDKNDPMATGTMSPQEETAGSHKLNANAFSKPGYSFKGWSTTPTGPVVYPDEASYDFTADATLYAQWEANSTTTYNVTYDANGGTTTAQDTNNYNVGDIVVVSTAGAIRVNHSFAGWAYGGMVYGGNDTFVMPANDVTLVAQWVPTNSNNVTINYLADANGSVDNASETLDAATGTAVGSTATPNSGYSFFNWTNTSGAAIATTAKYVPSKNGAGFYESATYTAHFRKNILPGDRQTPAPKDYYTIIFNKGSDGALTAVAGYPLDISGNLVLYVLKGVSYGEVYTALGNVVPDSGYRFSRWSPSLPADSETVNSDAIYTAQYRRGRGRSSRSSDVLILDPQIPLGELDKLNHHAYIQGYPDGSVRPQGNITREEVAAVFFRLLESDYREKVRCYLNYFSDVDKAEWSNKHISTLALGRILNGYNDGTFRPHDYITRAELAVIASRFDKLDLSAQHNLTDISGHWAELYIASAVSKGWVKGYPDGSFKPEQFISRAEFATLVNNVLGRHVTEKDVLPNARKFTDLARGKWYYTAMVTATNSYLYEALPDFYQKWTEIIYPEIEM